MDTQIVSKRRVADHGEVLTGRREVNAINMDRRNAAQEIRHYERRIFLYPVKNSPDGGQQ
jgi:hypothetical protein